MCVDPAQLGIDVVGAPAELVEDEDRRAIEFDRARQRVDDVLWSQRTTAGKAGIGTQLE